MENVKSAFSTSARIQISSPDFESWFSGSKVTDQQGRPLVLFHSTAADFDPENFHPLSHFGSAAAAEMRFEDKVISSQSARSFPVFLNIANPLMICDLGVHDKRSYRQLCAAWPDMNCWNSAVDFLLTAQEERHCFEDIRIQYKNGQKILPPGIEEELKNSDILPEDLKTVQNLWMHRLISVLEAKGYDGFMYENCCEDQDSISYVAFRACQVRPALVEPVYKSAIQYLAKTHYGLRDQKRTVTIAAPASPFA